MGTSTQGVSLGTAEAGLRDRTWAAACAVLLLLLFAVTAPFADRSLTHVPSFVPIYDAVVIVLDAITAMLLWTQYKETRERSFLALACGYAFTPIVIAAHALSFPDVFRSGSLIGGAQTTAWLWMVWHALFPAFVIAYGAVARRERSGGVPPARVTGGTALVLSIALAAMVTALMIFAEDQLPTLMLGSVYQSPRTKWVLGTAWGLHLIGIAALVYASRLRRLLDLWIAVVLFASLLDLALSALLVTGRYQLGFYAGRFYGLLASLFVLGLLLRQAVSWQSRLARASAAQAASEQKYRTLFQTMDQGYALTSIVRDREGRAIDIRFLEVNPTWERLKGMSAEQARGRGLYEMSPETDPWWLEQFDRIARSREPERLEYRQHDLGRWFEASVYPRGEDQLHVLFDEITERRKAEEALRESEEKYRSLFEKMGQGYSLNEVVRDAEGRAIDLRYVELNPAFERLTGASVSEARPARKRGFSRP